MKNYYNTNNLKGDQLIEANQNALSQSQKILRYFQKYPGHHFSPDFVWIHLFRKSVPITSVRRAITNLTIQGRLVKTDSMCEGYYKKPVHRWKLAKN